MDNYQLKINYSDPSSLVRDLSTQRKKLAKDSLRLGFGLNTYVLSEEIYVVPFGKEIGEP